MRIDPHVHFRDGEQDYKETIRHGLKVAREQKVDIVFDMPNTSPPILNQQDVEARLKLVPDGQENRYFMYVGATTDDFQLAEAVHLAESHKNVIGIKLYAGKLTGDLTVISQTQQRNIYRSLVNNEYKGVLAVHCEKESLFKDVFNPYVPDTHGRARPKEAEIESIKDQIRFSKDVRFQGQLHICHVSCPESVREIDFARKQMWISCGVTPHHLLWDEEYLKGDEGLIYKTNPPLRSSSDVLALREQLKRGLIDWIETDHAPHTIGEKLYGPYPSGFPSLYLYRDFVENWMPMQGIDKKRIEDMTYNNIMHAFELFL